MFRIKPYTHQRCSEGSNSRTPNPTETEPELFQCLLQRYGSAVACCRGRGSGCSRPGYEISPLGGGCHLPHHRATRIYTGLGKQTLGGHKQYFVHTRTQEKGAVSPKETDPDLLVSVQESPGESWVGGGQLQGWGY